MELRTRICFELSRRMMKAPDKRTVDYGAYDRWRQDSLQASWKAGFRDDLVAGKDVLDFGCGDGQLSFFLEPLKPKSITGIDITDAIQLARQRAQSLGSRATFVMGATGQMPLPAQSVDTILAFDCMEHVMNPLEIFREWHRVLRPGGTCAIEWFPFKGPWGPHMEALIPIPWAHVLFGQNAMFRTAEAIYDLPAFVPRHWDLDARGQKKQNKWAAWSSFKEQNFINELDVPTFKKLANSAGLNITRLERRSFSSGAARAIGSVLKALPILGDYFVNYTLIEMVRE